MKLKLSHDVITSLVSLEKLCLLGSAHVFENYHNSTDVCDACNSDEYCSLIDLQIAIQNLISDYVESSRKKRDDLYNIDLQKIVAL